MYVYYTYTISDALIIRYMYVIDIGSLSAIISERYYNKCTIMSFLVMITSLITFMILIIIEKMFIFV